MSMVTRVSNMQVIEVTEEEKREDWKKIAEETMP